MRIIIILVSLNCISTLNAQVPQSFNFQTIIRDSEGKVKKNQLTRIRFSILKESSSGTPVYVETHIKSTNEYGVLELLIGSGTNEFGLFNEIDWGGFVHFLKTEIDPNGSSSYSISTVTQFMSVPYSLYSGNSDTSNYASIADTVLNAPDNSDTNEIELPDQTLSDSNKVLISDGKGGLKWDIPLPSLFFTPNNFTPNNLLIFTSDDSFEIPEGVNFITIEASGGGGGGGGSGADMYNGTYGNRGATGGGGGGGAGEYVGMFLKVNKGDIVNFTIGNGGMGGMGGISGNGEDGDNGGNTIVYLNSHKILEANGGIGGVSSAGNSGWRDSGGGVGGNGGTGSHDFTHHNGENGKSGVTAGYYDSASLKEGGEGGKGPSPTLYSNIGGKGANGTSYGIETGPGNSGGSGTTGVVVISYY